MEPEELPNEPLDPIPLHCFPQAFSDNNPQARPLQIVIGQRNDKMGCLPPPAQLFDALKIPPPPQTIRLGKSGIPCRLLFGLSA